MHTLAHDKKKVIHSGNIWATCYHFHCSECHLGMFNIKYTLKNTRIPSDTQTIKNFVYDIKPRIVWDNDSTDIYIKQVFEINACTQL